MRDYRNTDTYYSSKPTFNYRNINSNLNANTNSNIKISSNYSPSKFTQQQKYSLPQFYKSSNYRSPTSKIGQLNQQIIQQTDSIRRRSHYNKYNNFDTRSASSQLRRSRISADGRRSSPRHSHYNYNYNNNYNNRYEQNKVYYPYEKTYSLSNSRSSDKILNNPIITHSSTITQPILATNIQLQQAPSFKKVKQTPQPISTNKPILKNTANSMFQQGEVNSYQTRAFTKNNKPVYTQDVQQFLDMDLPTNKPLESYRDSSLQSIDPMSPVTYKSPSFTHRNSDEVQKQIMKTKLSPILNPNASSTSFGTKVADLLRKFDNQGKLITLVLVGVGIILVIFQAIR